MIRLSRRRLIGSLGAGAGGLLLSGCDKINSSPAVQSLLGLGEKATFRAQRIVSDRAALAPEYTASDMSPFFRTNGNRDPGTPEYDTHVANGFADWQLAVDGLVANPLSLSLAQIRSLPRRTQITRHDCVEGWSAIGQWTGLPLGMLLKQAGLRSAARYVVFHCADLSRGVPYYESIDLIDAFHPQTILAWGMNGQTLDVGHGAPLRLRVERQLGYKQAKYVMRVEAVASLAGIGGGKGGYWEDVVGYQWYAGI
ncbi:molybdopterin-dependent oxidoreductase [Sphingomonas sp. CGMCC 1.13654]|uniref:Molybdopterin-dependent oxidoreductase n=1 Tax=Sphingomonas chungangi TaxID=2683589 RepID=A0A838LA81_9SPHN|nr:molybdopterin-dependent oxidoreductase [Sphingomonas chungangi]MVW55557.1 molybdopterin-dependent oxidoreductase [Sphingomonas chungangi]